MFFHNVIPAKTAVEVEEDLKKEFEKKLRVPDSFNIPHGWLERYKGTTIYLTA